MVISLFLGYLPWYNYSAVVSYIAADLSLSSSDTGMILSAFQLGYVIVVIIRLIDIRSVALGLTINQNQRNPRKAIASPRR